MRIEDTERTGDTEEIADTDGIGSAPLAVVRLDAAVAGDPAVVGAKAANLARAAAAGLPVLPGFVLVAADRAPGAPAGTGALRSAWERLTAATARSAGATGAAVPPSTLPPPPGPDDPGPDAPSREAIRPDAPALVVRSSSAHEDTGESSMAGRFDSVLDVRGWEAFTQAVRQVLDSASRVPPGAGRGADDPLHGMAVLVQPMLTAAAGGVMFGADPVEGRPDHILVSAVTGGPDRLVDGSTQGVRYQLTRRGRLLHTEPDRPRGTGPLGRRRLAQLVRLARRTEKIYGGPQDVEFGFDDDGRLWLFQARPITAMAARPPRGARLLGPGPVAETLPGVLQPLEEDLWLAPMNQGLTLALDIAGAAPRRKLRRLPVATAVDGRAAADLVLLGAVPAAHPVLNFINPAPGARRAGAAWRVGRLRTALPLLARDLMADVDRQLHNFAEPRQMLSGELLTAVAWGRTVLASLHAQESLAGALLDTDTGSTAVGEALAVLAEGRDSGRSDAELVRRHPVLLTLLPPSLGERVDLPQHVGWNGVPRGVGFLSVREGLRLRIRWVQEMQTSMVREMGSRIDAHCPRVERGRIALLRWRELTTVADGGARPRDLAERLPRRQTPPLPAAFRLAEDGRPQAVRIGRGPGDGEGEGQGAGGGLGTGTAWDGEGPRPQDPVLVVRSLDPALAGLLPDLAGLVAETGSVLSHLAVLAREYHVPTVVGVPRAVERYAPGTTLTVDGATGTIEAAQAAQAPRTAPGEGPPDGGGDGAAAGSTGPTGRLGSVPAPGTEPEGQPLVAARPDGSGGGGSGSPDGRPGRGKGAAA
ncbi:pyruvate, water dikinase [Actinacidiphila yanglinensis]|uniref:Pyruvate, water dikinase n=1 Tax=Actinacidiphila yanglinensis TaxID=310779 RepID=A0A1H6E5B0_9ACTN|nr:PEP/pyruvate-binding domain-containing protein [Actinacidiphila yanglinensis]SEG92872.1 pyruvate, water dikinase [Actinacidiphila yanglinensis]